MSEAIEIEALKEQVKNLTLQIEALEGKNSTFSKDDIVKKIEEKMNISKEDALQAVDTLSEEIRKSPIKSFAIAMGLGFIAAKVLK